MLERCDSIAAQKPSNHVEMGDSESSFPTLPHKPLLIRGLYANPKIGFAYIVGVLKFFRCFIATRRACQARDLRGNHGMRNTFLLTDAPLLRLA